jgi:hypothetical protein
LRALVTGLVDYAGLFPPAALPMRDVVANYASYLASPDAWMLGRLVVPVARLEECLAERTAHRGVEESAPWRISALVSDIETDAAAMTRWNEEHGTSLLVDTCEVKASASGEIDHVAGAIDPSIVRYVEIPVVEDPAFLIDGIARYAMRAKIRTGGVTADAFPSPAQVARFLVRCHERNVAFKATAGLHHPLTGTYALTYAADAPRARMFGFLNLFVAANEAFSGAPVEQVTRVLENEQRTNIDFADDTMSFHGESLSMAAVSQPRAQFAMSFGSCSFREPVDDLQQLGIL